MAIACALAFVILAIIVKHQGFATPDRDIGFWFAGQVRPSRTLVALIVTQFGSDVVTVGITAIVAFAVRKRSRYWMRRLWVTVCGGIISNEILKFIFYRQRPQFPHPLLELDTKSFPSGHTLAATVLFGSLILLTWAACDSARVRIAVVPFAIAMIVLIAGSRLYLGVHYLSDVLGGILEGIVWINGAGMVLDRLKTT